MKKSVISGTGVIAALFLLLLLSPRHASAQTAGGSVVLAKCNSWVSFSVNEYSGEVEIKNICAKQDNPALVDIYLNTVKSTETISYGSSVFRGGFTAASTIKIVNIEKGNSGTTCNKRGPKDSDVRVYIPSNATQIKTSNIVSGSTCTVCGADFNPIRK